VATSGVARRSGAARPPARLRAQPAAAAENSDRFGRAGPGRVGPGRYHLQLSEGLQIFLFFLSPHAEMPRKTFYAKLFLLFIVQQQCILILSEMIPCRRVVSESFKK
jgi:hypothetical protein